MENIYDISLRRGDSINFFICRNVSICFKGLSSGSFLLEVEHPDYVYEPIRRHPNIIYNFEEAGELKGDFIPLK